MTAIEERENQLPRLLDALKKSYECGEKVIYSTIEIFDGADINTARAEYASLLARIEELENELFDAKEREYPGYKREKLIRIRLKKDNEAMKRVVEAAQEWNATYGGRTFDEIDARRKLAGIIEDYELSR